MNDSTGRMSSMVSLVLRRAGIFFLLAFALLAQSGLGPTDRAAGSGQPTAVEGVVGRARGGNAPAAQPATEPSIARRGCWA